jgi:hypothetical protein
MHDGNCKSLLVSRANDSIDDMVLAQLVRFAARRMVTTLGKSTSAQPPGMGFYKRQSSGSWRASISVRLTPL